ncbi:MAG: RNA polymerase sigma factor [Acidimicrobiia bacterium]|nr:RNA polymerase sigma factor [Acidimicrobiia bacterium]
MILFMFPGAPSSAELWRLIRQCADSGDADSWERFVGLVQPVIAGTVYRVSRRFGQADKEIVDDLVQDALLRVCANRCRVLREFESENPEAVFGLMKSIAFSVAHDHWRGRLTEKRGAGVPEQSLEETRQADSQSEDSQQEMERRILIQEIDGFLRSSDLRPEDRRIFWLYYRQGLTARAIAAIPAFGLTQKGVESVIQRTSGKVRAWLIGRSGGNPEGKSA